VSVAGGPIERAEFEAAALIAEHPPRWGDRNKEVVFRIASDPGIPFAGLVRYARWPKAEPPPAVAARSRVGVRDGFFDYAPSGQGGEAEWHMNFADPRLFVAYGSPLLAQDEMQVAEHPVLGSLREALLARGPEPMTCEPWGGPTPVTVTGVQRRCAIETTPDAAAGHPHDLYGNAFAGASEAEVRAATRPLSPPPLGNILAMAAPAGGRGPYARSELQDILDTAYSGFTATRYESEAPVGAGLRTIVHTGFWGCGAYGGDRTVMTILQALAADLAGVDLDFHAGKGGGAVVATRALEDYAGILGVTREVPRILDELERRGFRWGESDGN
jgi:hypothetical protein